MEDAEVGGVTVKQGQRVGLVYSSANFDETVFDDPHSFNILRDPNPHVGFGGGGAHFCVGANLAKVEINLMFNAIADHLPDITQLQRAHAPAVGLAQRPEGLPGQLRRLIRPQGPLVELAQGVAVRGRRRGGSRAGT